MKPPNGWPPCPIPGPADGVEPLLNAVARPGSDFESILGPGLVSSSGDDPRSERMTECGGVLLEDVIEDLMNNDNDDDDDEDGESKDSTFYIKNLNFIK